MYVEKTIPTTVKDLNHCATNYLGRSIDDANIISALPENEDFIKAMKMNQFFISMMGRPQNEGQLEICSVYKMTFDTLLTAFKMHSTYPAKNWCQNYINR